MKLSGKYLKPNLRCPPSPHTPGLKQPTPQSLIRCFSCGTLGHKSSSCINIQKGIKCFNCNFYGHKSNVCPSPHAPKSSSASQSTVSSINFNTRTGMHVSALFSSEIY